MSNRITKGEGLFGAVHTDTLVVTDSATIPELVTVTDSADLDSLTLDGVPITNRIYGSYTFAAVADMVDRYVFIALEPMNFVAGSLVYVTAEAGGTVGIMFRRCQGTEAPASGDALLTGNLSGTATAATVQNGTVVGTSVVAFDPGDRLAVDFITDTPGELAGLTVTWAFELSV